MNTRIHYLYRDASNYKFWGQVVVEGEWNEAKLRPYFVTPENFTPQEWGLPSLHAEVLAQGFELDDDDHDYHELLKCELTEDAAELRLVFAECIGCYSSRRLGGLGWFKGKPPSLSRALTEEMWHRLVAELEEDPRLE